MNEKTLQQSGEALTGKATEFSIDILPISKIHGWLQKNKYFSRWFPGKRYFELTPLTTGNVYRIASLFLKIGITDTSKDDLLRSSFKIMAEHMDTVLEITAIAITNREKMPSKELTKFLRWNLSASELFSLFVIVIEKINITAFLHTIISIKGLNVLESESSSNAENQASL